MGTRITAHRIPRLVVVFPRSLAIVYCDLKIHYIVNSFTFVSPQSCIQPTRTLFPKSARIPCPHHLANSSDCSRRHGRIARTIDLRKRGSNTGLAYLCCFEDLAPVWLSHHFIVLDRRAFSAHIPSCERQQGLRSTAKKHVMADGACLAWVLLPVAYGQPAWTRSSGREDSSMM